MIIRIEGKQGCGKTTVAGLISTTLTVNGFSARIDRAGDTIRIVDGSDGPDSHWEPQVGDIVSSPGGVQYVLEAGHRGYPFYLKDYPGGAGGMTAEFMRRNGWTLSSRPAPEPRYMLRWRSDSQYFKGTQDVGSGAFFKWTSLRSDAKEMTKVEAVRLRDAQWNRKTVALVRVKGT